MKLENVIYNDKHIKIIDFGVSCSYNNDTLCDAHDQVGSPAYLPPERFIPHLIPLTVRDWIKYDIFAFGLMCYELGQYNPENNALGYTSDSDSTISLAKIGIYEFPTGINLDNVKSSLIRNMAAQYLIADPKLRPFLT
jgi:serine/threonine protein kinase